MANDMDGTPRRRQVRPANKSSSTHEESPSTVNLGGSLKTKFSDIALVLSDFALILILVFGGCCSNVWSFEKLLRSSPHVGSTITFSQALFISCQGLPQFIVFQPTRLYKTSLHLRLPRLAPRRVPVYRWALQVLVLTSGSLLNNWAFAYDVPLTLQIVFRSSGLPVSMLFGYVIQRRRYSFLQLLAVTLVTLGVVLTTLSRPPSPSPSSSVHSTLHEPKQKYRVGVSLLSASLLLTAALGVMQERTYAKYGPCWREGVFYTHFLSLPIFVFLARDIRLGYALLGEHSSTTPGSHSPYIVLAVNLATQLICVSGVNRLTSKVNSVSTNLVLTVRKAISLCLSVWLFQSDWNSELILGAMMVFTGSLLYTTITNK